MSRRKCWRFMLNRLLPERLRQLLRRKFVQDTLALQIGSIVRVAVNFISSVLIARLMGPTAYGEWALTASYFAIWQAFNLTGIGPSTMTRLSAAVGARDSDEALNLLAFYVRMVVLWAIPCIALMTLVGIPLASRLYSDSIPVLGLAVFPETWTQPNALIGIMAAIYAWVLLPDGFYNLVITALQSRREMRMVAILQDVNALILGASVVIALIISPTLPGIIFGRLAYSVISMVIALLIYERVRTGGKLVYPPFMQIIARARHVPMRSYWRFGFVIALDRNVSNLLVQIPMQITGIFVGTEAAGYLQLALRAIQLPNNLTSAIFDNMQAVVPEYVGRGNYRGLLRNFNRALLILLIGSVAFYSLLALFVVVLGTGLVTVVYGTDWLPALPFIGALCIFGAVTTVGGIFGPLYRALNLVTPAMFSKVLVLVAGILPGIWLVDQASGLGGAWMINLLFAASVLLTAFITLPVLRQRALEPVESVEFDGSL
jgi:O-antigen/teichoic acid export membrane protein